MRGLPVEKNVLPGEQGRKKMAARNHGEQQKKKLLEKLGIEGI